MPPMFKLVTTERRMGAFINIGAGRRDLEAIIQKLDLLLEQGEKMHKEFLDLSKKIDDATNAVATRIDKLSSQIKNSMTDAEVAEVKASLQAEVDRLTVLGQDPVNPIPPE